MKLIILVVALVGCGAPKLTGKVPYPCWGPTTSQQMIPARICLERFGMPPRSDELNWICVGNDTTAAWRVDCGWRP